MYDLKRLCWVQKRRKKKSQTHATSNVIFRDAFYWACNCERKTTIIHCRYYRPRECDPPRHYWELFNNKFRSRNILLPPRFAGIGDRALLLKPNLFNESMCSIDHLMEEFFAIANALFMLFRKTLPKIQVGSARKRKWRLRGTHMACFVRWGLPSALDLWSYVDV